MFTTFFKYILRLPFKCSALDLCLLSEYFKWLWQLGSDSAGETTIFLSQPILFHQDTEYWIHQMGFSGWMPWHYRGYPSASDHSNTGVRVCACIFMCVVSVFVSVCVLQSPVIVKKPMNPHDVVGCQRDCHPSSLSYCSDQQSWFKWLSRW